MHGGWIRGAVARGSVAAVMLGLLTAGGSIVLAADHGVDIAGFAFSPGSVTVTVGDSVTWTNADAQGHTATADDASFDTGTIAGSTSKSVTFATAGTFPYHCKIHPTMTGTIVVEAAAGGGGGAGGASSPPTIPPADAATPAAQPATGQAAALGLLALAALLGFTLAERRFGRRS